MTTVTDQHTVLPPNAEETQQLERLAAVLSTSPDQRIRLADPDGSEVALPEIVSTVLREVADALAHGRAVSVTPLQKMLSTQQAAEMLNISRPTLIKLLDEGEISYEQPGRHRRIRLADVLDYQQRTRHQRRAMLDELTRTASQDGTADEIDGFARTR